MVSESGNTPLLWCSGLVTWDGEHGCVGAGLCCVHAASQSLQVLTLGVRGSVCDAALRGACVTAFTHVVALHAYTACIVLGSAAGARAGVHNTHRVGVLCMARAVFLGLAF